MKNLEQLTAQYEKAFKSICKKVERDGMSEHFEQYNDIMEVCIELHIDTDSIKELNITQD